MVTPRSPQPYDPPRRPDARRRSTPITDLDPRAAEIVETALERGGLLLVLTGAGISAASGIPTFRGPEGYWTVGSEVYTPERLATSATFRRQPEQVWGWYLWRLGVCRAAAPNAAHEALVELERLLGERFLLVTQNVDGLHQRAGSSPQRTYPIHGHLERMRCADACHRDLRPVPEDLPPKDRDEPLTEVERERLTCPRCGGWMRPHVLWFDEVYDEEHFRFDSSLRAAEHAALLVTVGTSGATNLPMLIVQTAVQAGAALLDVNPDLNPFGELADRLPEGLAVRAPATDALPALRDHLGARSR